MPNFGLSKPTIGKLNPETGKYSDVIKCGEAVNTTVTPNYNSASFYSDNQKTEDVSEFKDATVALGVNALPIRAAEILFGHTIAEDGTETDKTDDSGSYVGYGFVTSEMKSGVKKYRACFLFKCKFTEGEESYQTRGDNITFTNPTLNGSAMGNKDGEWRKKSPYFETEAQADEWIAAQMGVTAEKPAESPTDNPAQTPDETGQEEV